MELTCKIAVFKKHFDIESKIDDVEFFLHSNKNLVGKFEGIVFILTNQRNKKIHAIQNNEIQKKDTALNFYARLKLKGLRKKLSEQNKSKYTQISNNIADW